MDHKTVKHTTPHDLTITTTLGDIIKVKADAVVTGEGCHLKTDSGITVALENAIPEFRNVRHRLREACRNQGLEPWTVTTSHIGSPFKHVIHAVLMVGNDDAWVKNMRTLYKRIFKEADRLKIYAIAVPLLRAGTADKAHAIKALITSAREYRPSYLTNIMIVSNDIKVLDMIVTQIQFEECGISEPSDGFFSALLSGVKRFGKSVLSVGEDNHQQQHQTHRQGRRRDYRQLQVPAHFKGERNQPHTAANFTHQPNKHAGTKDRTKGQNKQPRQKTAAYWEDEHQLAIALQKSKQDANIQRKQNHSTEVSSEEQRQVEKAKRISKQEADTSRKRHQYPHSQGVKSRPEYFNHSSSSTEDTHLQIALQLSREAVDKHKAGASVTGEPPVSKDSPNNTDSNVSTDNESDFEIIEGEETDDREVVKQATEDTSLTCPICLNDVMVPKRLDKCGHTFCKDCIERSFQDFKPVCPSCNMVYGEVRGNQPDGHMDVVFSSQSLPDHHGCGTITITYSFPSGTQKEGHPNPGQPYKGTTRKAYLPNSKEGKAILKLLETAFDRKLTFTIGRSTTTGREGVVTWNDIHHKTNMDGGPTSFGYPDPTYLSRVRDELASKGVS